MRLLSPGLLYCIVLVPMTILVYIWGIHRRQPYVVRMSSLSLVRESARNLPQWRRHHSFSFFLIALTSLLIAICQPVITLDTSSKQGIIILALDVSRSMCSPDVQPTRLQALEATLVRFIAAQRSTTKIGVVAFSDFAELIQPPTNDRTALSHAIRSLMTGWERAIGDGIYESLDVIAKEEGPPSTPPPPNGYRPAVIILVTNGDNNAGPSPLDAARLAAKQGIRIYTVGLSSPSGPVDTSCQSSDPSEFSAGTLPGNVGPSGVDAKTLEQIAALTGAKYFPALGISGLKNVFKDSHLQTILVSENVEVTFGFVILGALFAMLSFLVSFLWNPLL